MTTKDAFPAYLSKMIQAWLCRAAKGQVPPTAQPSSHKWEVASHDSSQVKSSQVNKSGLAKARAEDRYIYNVAQVPGLNLNGTPEQWAEAAWVGVPGEPGQVNEDS